MDLKKIMKEGFLEDFERDFRVKGWVAIYYVRRSQLRIQEAS